MKNKVVVLNDDKKGVYRTLVRVEIGSDSYIIYTNDEMNSCGDLICYASKYEDKNGKQMLTPIKEDEILELLDSVLLQVQSKMNKLEEK